MLCLKYNQEKFEERRIYLTELNIFQRHIKNILFLFLFEEWTEEHTNWNWN